MPQFTPGIRLPFAYVQGIPREAAVQIRRDFEELIRNITPAASPFDCIIDSELTASIPATRQYKNLTDLLANESWTGHLVVGVRQGPTAITEAGSCSLAGKGDLSLFGVNEWSIPTGTAGQIAPWKLQGIAPSSKNVTLFGLRINPPSSQQIGVGAGYIGAIDCDFGDQVSGFNAAGIVGQSGVCVNCTFNSAIAVNGSIGVNVENDFYDCRISGGVTCLTQGSVIIHGGYCGGFSTSSSVGSTVETDFRSSNLVVGDGGGTFTNTGSNGGTVSVTDAVHTVIVNGNWTSVTFSGVPALLRRFQGVSSFIDFTGPGQIIAGIGPGQGGCTLRGNSVRCDIEVRVGLAVGLGPIVNAVGLTHSLVTVSSVGNNVGAGTKAYAFDVASNHNILIFSGSFAAEFTSASTDAGSHNRVITEDSDTLMSSTLTLLRDSGQLRGPPGDAGEDGEPGPPGPPGNAGPAGTNGSIGGPGPPGVAYAFDGADGDDGFPYPGPQGQQGVAGPAGSYGPPGMDGEPGDDGFPYPGPQGQQGVAGAPGAAGSQGTAGPIGADGVDGEDGMFLGPTGQPVADIYDSGLYGDKSMGNLAVDGTSAVTGMTRAGTVYTLTQDIYADFITLSGTVTVINAGNFRIFCKGLVALVNCIIHNDGAAGAGATGGVSPGFFTAGDNRVGGNGAAGAAGGSGAVAIRSLGGASGAGGAATAGPGIGGGTAGSTATALATGVGGPGVHRASDASAGFANNAANGAGSGNFYQGGAGGPGGTAAAGTGTGGGGGAGGGILYLFAQRVIVPAGVTLTLRAAGGAGGNGTAGTSAGTGGGAGGGGGAVVLVTSERTQVAGTLTLSVPGGNGGTPTGTGKTGTAGNSGNTYDISAV